MTIALLALGIVAYAYVGYPLILWVMAGIRRARPLPPAPRRWPPVTVVVPVFDGEATIASALEAILASDYPGPRQVLVLSDGSRDRTDAIVSRFAERGVELIRLPERVGKTEAENRTLDAIRGEIVINTDASVRIDPHAITALVRALADPEVGVASSTDVSVDSVAAANAGETAYVGYEMRLRMLETEVWGIVGASGSLYAIRTALHRRTLPAHLSRDFSSALHARVAGFRAVSVPEARCYVPRGRGGKAEYRRKVRTMARGLMTLGYHRRLLDPLRYGVFAWMLLSHKLLRWLTPVALVVAGVGLGLPSAPAWARWPAGAALVAGALGWWWPGRVTPRLLALPAYALGGIVAGLHAWARALRGDALAIWEPTRRPVTTPRDGPASPAASAP